MGCFVRSHPVSDQGALASSRFAGDQDLLLSFLQPALQLIDVAVSTDVPGAAGTRPAVVSMFARFLLQGIRLLAFWELPIDQRPEVVLDLVGNRLGARQPLHQRVAAGADALSQQFQLLPVGWIVTAPAWFARIGLGVTPGRIAEVEESAAIAGVAAHLLEPLLDLQLRVAGLADLAIEPLTLLQQLRGGL